MRVVTNQRRVKRSRQIAQYLFFFSLAVLIGGLVLTNTLARADETLLLVSFAVMPLGLVTTIISVRLTNQYVRLPHPEDAIRDGLKGINRSASLYNYVLKPHHVLVTPQGVFALTTRFQETPFKVQGEKWTNFKARGPLAPIFLFLKQEALGDPFKQANQEAEAVQEAVNKVLPDAGITVTPVVVFTSSKATLEVIDPIISVVYADGKKKPSLKSLLRDEKKKDGANLLTDTQLRALDKAFLAPYGEAKEERQFVEDEA